MRRVVIKKEKKQKKKIKFYFFYRNVKKKKNKKEKIFIMETNEIIELYKIIVGERGYLQPQKYIRTMFEYYNAKGWPQGSKGDLMRFWMSGVRSKHNCEPTMSERERAYMVKFMSVINAELVIRFFDLLIDFQLTEDYAAFYFHEENMQKIADWMIKAGIADIMSDFVLEIKIRKA